MYLQLHLLVRDVLQIFIAVVYYGFVQEVKHYGLLVAIKTIILGQRCFPDIVGLIPVLFETLVSWQKVGTRGQGRLRHMSLR